VGKRAPRDGQGRVSDANGYDRRGGQPDDFAGRPRPSGEMVSSRQGGPRGGPAGGFRSGTPLRWLGTTSTLTAALVLVGATLIGVVLTLIKGTEPGNLLGFFVILGTFLAAIGVRRGAVHLFFPVPALAFFVAAVITGIVHDRELASSTAGLGASFAQWVAGIFWPAVVATGLVLLVGGIRWLLKNPLATGRQAPGNVRSPQGFRSPAASSWADDRFTDDAAPRSRTGPTPRPGTGPTPRQGTGPTPGPSPRQGTGPTPRQGTGPTPRQGTGPTPGPGTGPTPRQGTGPTPRPGTGPTPRQGTGPTPRPGTGPAPRQGGGTWRGPGNGSRPGRDQGTDRDPWGDPRLPPDRSQPAGPRPQAPGTGPRPQAPARPASQPMPRTPRQGQTGPGPTFNPAPSPQHPPRRQPPDGRA
jgi:Domain of unknown function (DUF6542)